MMGLVLLILGLAVMKFFEIPPPGNGMLFFLGFWAALTDLIR